MDVHCDEPGAFLVGRQLVLSHRFRKRADRFEGGLSVGIVAFVLTVGIGFDLSLTVLDGFNSVFDRTELRERASDVLRLIFEFALKLVDAFDEGIDSLLNDLFDGLSELFDGHAIRSVGCRGHG